MSNKQFGILAGVGTVCIVAILAIASCVKHITSLVLWDDEYEDWDIED